MKFNEQDLVKITAISSESDSHPQQDLLDRVGFIEYIEVRRPRGPGLNPSGPGGRFQYHVGILSEEGLDRIVTIPECYLTLDTTQETKQLYDAYQLTLDDIQREANDRHHQKIAVTNHLSRKHSITPDEVHGIYKAMLYYQEYYKENL